MMAQTEPDLSVVVTIVDGGDVLDHHLAALTSQAGGHNLEILVPYDHLSRDAAALTDRYPTVRFIDLGTVLDGRDPKNPFELHDFFDVRRSGALKLARGPLIAILEDRGIPKPDWADEMIRLHNTYPEGVIGGAAENGVDRLKNWAIFFCDYGRYQAPLDVVDPEYVTDTNICYKRKALMSVQALWDVVYQESEVNWALRRAGAGLRLNDAPRVVQHRTTGGLAALARERFHWARMFGIVRGREIPRLRCAKYAVLAPALPFVLFLRHLRRQIQKGHHVGTFLMASPITFYLLLCWSLGECTGYLEALGGRSGKPSPKTGGAVH